MQRIKEIVANEFRPVSLLDFLHTINIGADIGAMAASVKLLVPQLPVIIATLSFTAFIIVSEVLIPYSKYVKILKYLTISLLAYVATAIIVGGDFKNLLLASIGTSGGVLNKTLQ
ncbi:MAG: hypothetical protein WBF33_29650 [Candidatus Nitrosopolaris sp.]